MVNEASAQLYNPSAKTMLPLKYHRFVYNLNLKEMFSELQTHIYNEYQNDWQGKFVAVLKLSISKCVLLTAKVLII